MKLRHFIYTWFVETLKENDIKMDWVGGLLIKNALYEAWEKSVSFFWTYPAFIVGMTMFGLSLIASYFDAIPEMFVFAFITAAMLLFQIFICAIRLFSQE